MNSEEQNSPEKRAAIIHGWCEKHGIAHKESAGREVVLLPKWQIEQNDDSKSTK